MAGQHQDERSRWPWLAALGLIVILLPLSYQHAWSAFTSSRSSGPNTFSAGSVGLTVDDNSGTAMFSIPAMKPSDPPVTRCVTVTNVGTLPLMLYLYSGTTTGTGLGSQLNLSVTRGSFGTPPAYPSCSTFSSAGTVYTGTLAAFPSTAPTKISDGGGVLAPGATRVFQFDLSLRDDSAGEGKTVSLPFTFYAIS